MSERARGKEAAPRDEIPAALTLNTYYTCYAIDKFILYLYRDRIYDLLYVILYLYGLLHISISPKLPFRRATASGEREKRRRDSERGRGSSKQTRADCIATSVTWTSSVTPIPSGSAGRSD